MTGLERFGRVTTVVDWRHPAIGRLARELARGRGPLGMIRACFEWVRDRIPHTVDYGLDPVTCSASEVLREGTGFCYAKSHLPLDAGRFSAEDRAIGMILQVGHG